MLRFEFCLEFRLPMFLEPDLYHQKYSNNHE